MKILTGDSYGLVKMIDTKKKCVDFKFGEANNNNPVVGLYQGQSSNISILKKKDIIIYDHTRQISLFESTPFNNNEFVSMFNKNDSDFTSTFVAENTGKIRLFRNEENSIDIIKESPYDLSIEKGTNINKISNCSKTNEFYCLFDDVPLKIYDIEKACVSFKSKNAPNDELDLKVPICDTDITEDKEKNSFYVSTAYGKIRTYDRRAKNSPVHDQTNFTNLPIKKINRLISVDNNKFCMGDNTGRVILLENRKNFIPIKTIARGNGAISDISAPISNTIVSVSKDRFLRVFDYKLNDETDNMYLKNQLSSLLFVETIDNEIVSEKEEEEDLSDNKENDNDEEFDDDVNDIDWDNIGYEQSFDDEEDDIIDDKKAKEKGFIVIDKKNKNKKKHK